MSDVIVGTDEWAMMVKQTINEKSLAEAGYEVARIVAFALKTQHDEQFGRDVDACVKSFWARCEREKNATPSPVGASVLREALAEYAHDAWSGWMKYMFSKCHIWEDKLLGTAIIPKWGVERWQRQMNTPYAELPENEKASDREEADKMLAILAQAHRGTSVPSEFAETIELTLKFSKRDEITDNWNGTAAYMNQRIDAALAWLERQGQAKDNEQ